MYALYAQAPRILLLLSVMFMPELGAQAVSLALALPKIVIDDICVVLFTSPTIILYEHVLIHNVHTERF
jgi:hypothetical protein